MNIIELARAAGIHPLAYSEEYISGLERFVAAAVAAEREACINACDTVYYQYIGAELGSVRYGIAACAAAIRARGQA